MEASQGTDASMEENRTASKGDTTTAQAVGCPSDTGMAGRAEVCQGCPGRELCSRLVGSADPDQPAIDIRMNACRRKIMVVSGKGGVGKSSVAVNLAISLAAKGLKVGLCDLDICGPSIPTMLKVQDQSVVNTQYGWTPLKSPHGGIKVMSIGLLLDNSSSAVVWRGPRKSEIIKRFLKDTFWGRLDYLLFDTPPGTSDEHLTVVSALKSVHLDGAIVVGTPQRMALDTVRKEVTFCRKMGVRVLGLVENLSGFACPCCEEVTALFGSGGVHRLAEETAIPMLATIPIDTRLSSCEEDGSSIQQEHPTCGAAVAFDSLRKCVQDIVET
ncbi:cytosolic Fe-S cluster assembly factor NUBP2 homolog [Sycon ciliatum]|uniref:cytosolic Fe-S cluster assembly factor NUBP2 homolog n=1 Tax=Sycon ciliatum TaxID=27933 RepID=UPI0031F67E14